MSIRACVSTRYVDDERELEYTFEPIEDSLTIKKTKQGYEASYLCFDQDYESPSGWGDDNLVLVHYHRDFWVENDKVITEDDTRRLYQGEKIDQLKDYHIFPVSAYIHSGVVLSLEKSFACDSGGWDTSHVGLVLVSKKEFKSKKKAFKLARGHIKTWNMALSGDVYVTVKETYNKNKEQVNYDCVGSNYGYKYALEELEEM